MTSNGDHAVLRALTPELVSLMDELPTTMFCAKDTGGRYVAVNEAFVRRTGETDRRRVLGKVAAELFVAPLAQRYAEQDQWVLATGRPLRGELELIRRPGGSPGWYSSAKLALRTRDRIVGVLSLSRDLGTQDVHDEALQSLTQVVALVQDRVDCPPSVAELARQAGCSVSVLGRRMHRVFGLSAQQYVLRARLDHAVVLLSTTAVPIADVAQQTGFYDQSSFTRTFASHTGETPLECRKRAAGQ